MMLARCTFRHGSPERTALCAFAVPEATERGRPLECANASRRLARSRRITCVARDFAAEGADVAAEEGAHAALSNGREEAFDGVFVAHGALVGCLHAALNQLDGCEDAGDRDS